MVSTSLRILLVTIRSAFIEETVRVFAGAGIVEGSQPVEEWLELNVKRQGSFPCLQRE